MRAKDCWVRAYAAAATAVYLYLCVFFFCISSSIFNAFLLISNQIYPRSYLFAIALIRIHCCFFSSYSYRLSLVLMYAQRICLSHGHRLNSTHTSRIESHWLSQCKANIHLFKNEFIHILYLIMLDRFIYTIFFGFVLFFCCFGDFLRFSRRRFFFFFILPSSALFLCFLQI